MRHSNVRSSRWLCTAATAASCLFFAHAVQASVVVPVDPAATFTLTNLDPALDTTPIDLAALGISPGDVVLFERLGEFSFDVIGPPVRPDDVTNMVGVFSTNDILLPSNLLNRVPGAVAPGAGVFVPWQTEPTFYGGVATAIPETFSIEPFALMVIPAGVQYLFVAPSDSFYSDNGDPNQNYAIRITNLSAAIPEASSMTLAGLAAAVGLVGWRLRPRRAA